LSSHIEELRALSTAIKGEVEDTASKDLAVLEQKKKQNNELIQVLAQEKPVEDSAIAQLHGISAQSKIIDCRDNDFKRN